MLAVIVSLFLVYAINCSLYLKAVGARFKIDRNRFDDFFRSCLRRTLAQLLCDVRREQKRRGNGINQNTADGSRAGVLGGGSTSTGRVDSFAHGGNSRDSPIDDSIME